ncbi:MAG: sugar transporter [Gammaproteobacteria bacterium]|nr:MAG: sugar transporter [Gammaproteobacteria bacterium]
MSRTSLVLFFALVSFSNVWASERYLLNAGDVLEISVWNEETLQKEVTVLPDGLISFPLAGELQAEGRSISDIQKELAENLTEYLTDPVVTVSVTHVTGNTVHIMGKVLKPGSFIMNQRLDVMQALSLAGGLSPYAEENNIIVLRRQGSQQHILSVHYAAIKKGKDLDTNILLHSGDVIVIP